MNITESKIQGKTSEATCEDGIAATRDFIAVVDGSTSKTDMRYSADRSNGRLCMELVCRCVEQMPADITVGDFCRMVTTVVRDRYARSACDIDRLQMIPTDRMAASAIVYSHARKEIWMVGDCQCIVDGTHYDNPKPFEAEIARDRAAVLRKALSEGTTPDELRRNDIGRKAILPNLRKACLFQNVGYPVIDGFKIPVDLVKVIKLNEGSHEIVLASDGYPILKPSLDESEATLKRLLEEDPLCISLNVATKGLALGQQSFDDRAYVRFTT